MFLLLLLSACPDCCLLTSKDAFLQGVSVWLCGALEAGVGEVGVGGKPGAAVEQAAARHQDQVVKHIADVAARLVDGTYDLRAPTTGSLLCSLDHFLTSLLPSSYNAILSAALMTLCMSAQECMIHISS